MQQDVKPPKGLKQMIRVLLPLCFDMTHTQHRVTNKIRHTYKYILTAAVTVALWFVMTNTHKLTQHRVTNEITHSYKYILKPPVTAAFCFKMNE